MYWYLTVNTGKESVVSIIMIGPVIISLSLLSSNFFLVLSIHQVKTEEQIAAEQAWYGSEKVWLIHKDGFSLGEISSHF